MPSCFVIGCAHESGRSPVNVKLHRFPKQTNLVTTWLRNCGVSEDELESRTVQVMNDEKACKYRVCSIHFEDRCFKQSATGGSKGTHPRSALLPDAVPTKNIIFQFPKKVCAPLEEEPCTSSDSEAIKVKCVTSNMVPVAFWDVAACFTEGDWKLLHEGQKVFYRNVMKEIHQALSTMGYKILNPETLLRVINWEDANIEDPEKLKRGVEEVNDASYSAASPTPDIFLRLKHEGAQICRGQRSSEEMEIGTSLRSVNQSPNPETLLQVIKFEDDSSEHPGLVKREADRNDSSSSYGFHPSDFILRIKEEDELYPIDHLDSERRLDVNSDPEHTATVKPESPRIIPTRWDMEIMEINRTEGQHIQSAALRSAPSVKSHASHMCTEHKDSYEEPTNDTKQSCQARPHECKYCNKVFDVHSELPPNTGIPTEHATVMEYKVVHPGGKCYMCVVCNKSFSKSYTLKVHQRIHGERPYGCPDCTKRFITKSDLCKHHRIHTGEKPYECSECKKTFRHSSALTVHRRTHTGENPYKCSECDKSFIAKSIMKSHQRIHGIKPYVCVVCTKCFASKSDLCTHQRSHTGEKPYECTVCKKAFTQLSVLRSHQRIHTGERPYECTECKKTFTQLSALRIHQRTHSGERPYACTKCEKTFRHDTALKAHQTMHTGEKPYMCKVCMRFFSNRSNMVKHQKIHTGEKPYACMLCQKSFTYRSHMINHQKTHTGEKPYNCTECGKNFSQTSHLKHHRCLQNEKKLYLCADCMETFTSLSSLLSHKENACGRPSFVKTESAP